jgi:sugar lactone lactonase YvrE
MRLPQPVIALLLGAPLAAGIAGVAGCARGIPVDTPAADTTVRAAGATSAAPAGVVSTAPADTGRRPVAVVEGFTGPEAVRYDPDQDVYFVSNFGSGSGGARDTNGFISRMRADGTIESLRWIAGGANGVVLHGPRGMYVVGDTLWVADFSGQDVGFLNDVAAAPDGRLYVTDTGKNRIYRVAGDVAIAVGDSALGAPNGITWDAANRRFIVVPYGGAHAIRAWSPESPGATDVGTSAGARFDGVEVLADGSVLVASQADSSIHRFVNGAGQPVIRVSGRPADIAVDSRRNRVAIPYISLNRVEIWQLPAR